MAVFSFRTMDQLFTGIKTLASRLIDPSHLVLSPDEFIAGFINPDHVASLKQVGSLVGGIGQFYASPILVSTDGTKCQTYCSFGYSSPPIIMPDYVNKGLQATAPDELHNRVAAWLDERLRIGYMFGDALDSLHWLNENCGNASAMAVMFPALPTILKAYDPEPESTSSKKAKRIADAKSFGSLPKLPREVKQRMVECSDLLLTVSMLEPGGEPSAKKGEAMLKFNGQPKTQRCDFIYASWGQGHIKNASFV